MTARSFPGPQTAAVFRYLNGEEARLLAEFACGTNRAGGAGRELCFRVLESSCDGFFFAVLSTKKKFSGLTTKGMRGVKKRLASQGNSAAARVPKKVVKEPKLVEGAPVTIEVK